MICAAMKNIMTKNVAGNVDEQSWTDAFEKRSTEGFEAALAAVEMASLNQAISRQPSTVNQKQAPPPRSASRRKDKLKGVSVKTKRRK